MNTSNPTKPGGSTSEGKQSLAVIVFGAVVAGLATTFGILEKELPEHGWIVLVAAIVSGIAGMAATVMGYSKSRATVKAADVVASAAKDIAGAQGTSAGLSTLGIQTPSSPTPPVGRPAPLP